jgi:hypothetical protein
VRPTAPRQGVVVLPHWGHDGRFLLEWCHRLTFGVAKLGGCGLLVHWPGSEDSEGDTAEVTVDQLVQAVLSALRTGRERFPEVPWSLAGIRLGATLASIASAQAGVHKVALVQPEFDPVSYFKAVERRARLNWARGAPHRGWGLGEEVPRGLKVPFPSLIRQAPGTALGSVTAVIHYRLPAVGPLPPTVTNITVRGSWSRPPDGDHRVLRRQALSFLCDRAPWRLTS